MTNDELSRKAAEVMGWKQHPRSTAMMHKSGVDFWIPMDELRRGRLAFATDATSILAAVREKGLRIVDLFEWPEHTTLKVMNPKTGKFYPSDEATLERALCKALIAACGEQPA